MIQDIQKHLEKMSNKTLWLLKVAIDAEVYRRMEEKRKNEP